MDSSPPSYTNLHNINQDEEIKSYIRSLILETCAELRSLQALVWTFMLLYIFSYVFVCLFDLNCC